MSQLDEREVGLSETDEIQQEDGKLVPVSESIRYRKRAQSAEKKVAVLENQLAQVSGEANDLTSKLSMVEQERRLSDKLLAAGAVDVEAAVLLAKSRIAGDGQADIDGVVEQLRVEKGYLFAGSDGEGVVASRKTATAKDRTSDVSSGGLERLAKKAVASGSRVDLQEYLKLRRNYV
ncbi:MAG: hypothetical protein KAS96_12855 [Planctomycetes bacterium]|nr:hypothetical protein [Planctomycetota bacterium]